MRRILAALLLALAVSSPRAEDIPILIAGKDAGRVYVYKVGEQRYLNAKQAIEAYGGRFAWHPVSKKIQLSIRGRQAQLTVDSTRARVGEKSIELPEPVIVRANTVLVPLQFFASPSFGELTWTSTKLDADGEKLEIEPKASVGEPRWFAHKEFTRVVVEFDKQLGFSLSRRGRSALDAVIPLGAIASPQELELGDRLIAGVRLSQEPKAVRLSIRLAEGAPRAAWDARTFDEPRRLVVDIFPDADALKRYREERGLPPPVVRGEASEPRPESDEPEEAPEPVKPAKAAAPAAAPPAHAPAAPPPVLAATAPIAPPPAIVTAIRPRPEAPKPALRAKRRIVIDPGHGGHDSGALGRRGVKEKSVNLAAAKALARLLKTDGTFEVLLTRDDDTFVPLAERSRMANDFEADLFVSLHCNANRSRSEKGFEIYFLSERASDPEAARVAEMENASLALEDNSSGPADVEAAMLLHAMARTESINEAAVAAGVLSKALAKKVSFDDRGVKQAAFYVLRGTNAPAILVEMGFVSNPSEESKLDSARFRAKIAEGLYAGILDFARRQEWDREGGE